MHDECPGFLCLSQAEFGRARACSVLAWSPNDSLLSASDCWGLEGLARYGGGFPKSVLDKGTVRIWTLPGTRDVPISP